MAERIIQCWMAGTPHQSWGWFEGERQLAFPTREQAERELLRVIKIEAIRKIAAGVAEVFKGLEVLL